MQPRTGRGSSREVTTISTNQSNSNALKNARRVADAYHAYIDENEYEPDTIYVQWDAYNCHYYNLMSEGLTYAYVLNNVVARCVRGANVDLVKCIDDDERVCEDCGEVMSESDAVRYEGSYYCEDCAIDSEDLTQCEECGEWVAECDLVEVRDYRHVGYCSDYTSVYVCEDCANSIAVKCDECGCWYMGVGDEDNQVEVRTADGGSEWRNLCGGCLEDNYTVCDVCNEYVHVDNAVYTDYGTYCPGCVSHVDLQDYGHTYKDMELRTGSEPARLHDLLMGVELETESDDNEATAVAVRDAVEAVTGRRDAVSCKSDGSLAGGGCEIVTQPFSPSYHLTTDFWRDVVSAARENGATSHDNGHCGLHVHISRDYLDTRNRVDAFVCLVGTFAPEWVKFSRRSMESARKWADPRMSAYKAFKDCPRWCDYLAAFAPYRTERYQFVNLRNSATIELRLMRGTLKLETLRATLEAVAALAIIAHEYEDAAHVYGWGELCELMLGMLASNNLPYEDLRDYLKRRELMPSEWDYQPLTFEQYEAADAQVNAFYNGEQPSDEVKRVIAAIA